MKISDLVPLNYGNEKVRYTSNDKRFKGIVEVPIVEVKGFEQLVKNEEMTLVKWESKIIQVES